MAGSPFYARPSGQLSPAGGVQTGYFGQLERSNSTGSAWSLSPADAAPGTGPTNAFDEQRLMSRSPGVGAGAGLSPASSSFQNSLDPSRHYTALERRPSRDAHGDSTVGTIGEGRKASSSTSVGTVGAIGEGRRMASSTTPTTERREEEAFLGLPTGYFNPDGSLAAPLVGSAGSRANGSDSSPSPTKSRPSSFILDVLPQTRERGGPPTPSLSLDSVSQPPASATDLFPLPSPHSLAPSSYLINSTQTSYASSPQSQAGHLFGGSSRTSSPGPIDGPASGPSGSPAVDALASKVRVLESNVSTLSNVLATEFRSLREELGLLRSLVQQQQQYASQNGGDRSDRDGSPVLTLRSPSPNTHASQSSRTPTFPHAIPLARPTLSSSLNGSMSSLHVQPATSPGAVSPSSSVASGFFASQQQQQQPPLHADSGPTDSASLKDEQIKLLTAQVNSLTSTVSTLLGSPAMPSNGFAPTGNASPMLNSSTSGSMPPMPPRGMTMPLGGSQALGLAVPGAGNGLGPSRVPPPMMRTASGTGLGRNASMRSVNGGLGAGSFDAAPMMSPSPSLQGWPEQPSGPASSAMMTSASAGGASAVGSPMIGSSGPGANPPGSLGSKWEMLGVGNELFRAVAKFG